MKNLRKIIAVVLCAAMLFTCIQSIACASTLYNEDEKTVTIFVEGINAAAIKSAETGENVFPPQASTIVSAVMKCIPAVAGILVSGDYEKAAAPICDAVYDIFAPISCDENGKPYDTTEFDWEWPDEEKVKRELERDDLGAQIGYSFDWRYDMKTIATDLHSYIEYIMDIADAEKVNLIGFSMGTCAVLSYLKLYDYEYVNSVVLLAGGYDGVSCCGEPFSGLVDLNPDSIVRFVDAMLGYDLTGVIVSSLLHYLNAGGILGSVTDWGNKFTVELKDAVYSQVFAKTFATMPGMWSLVPASCYDGAMAIIGDSLSDTTREMIEWYHDEVQANNRELIQGSFDRGFNTGIIVKYGYPGIPVMASADEMSDGMIDTRYESFGATCAKVNETLGDNYVQKVDVGFDAVSPDNMIDASTCEFPQYTWFVKNCYHSDNYSEMMELAHYIIQSEEQPDVIDGDYRQYLVLIGSELVEQTEDNCGAIYTADLSGDNFITITAGLFTGTAKALKQMIIDFFARFKALFTFGGKVC